MVINIMTSNQTENQVLGENAQKFKEYIEIIRAKHGLFCATIINLSIMQDETHRKVYVGVMQKWFEDLIKTFAGRFFLTNDGALIIVIKAIGVAAMEKRFQSFAEIISNDENFFARSGINTFAEIYRMYNFSMAGSFEHFVKDCAFVLSANDPTAREKKVIPANENGNFVKFPATARQISKAEEYISTVNLKNFVAQTPVFSFYPAHGVAEKLFTEATIKTNDLCKVLLPHNSIEDNSFLKSSLDDACQRRLLRLLAMRSISLGTKSVGLKLSQGAIASPEFLSFFGNQKWNQENFLVVEVDIYSVLHNINSYTDCLKYLRERGVIVGVHGVNLDVLSLVNVEYLDFDLLFFTPPEDYYLTEAFDIREIIKNIILQIRPERFILQNVDHIEQLIAGVNIGAQLFHGDKIDVLARQWLRDTKTGA